MRSFSSVRFEILNACLLVYNTYTIIIHIPIIKTICTGNNSYLFTNINNPRFSHYFLKPRHMDKCLRFKVSTIHILYRAVTLRFIAILILQQTMSLCHFIHIYLSVPIHGPISKQKSHRMRWLVQYNSAQVLTPAEGRLTSEFPPTPDSFYITFPHKTRLV